MSALLVLCLSALLVRALEVICRIIARMVSSNDGATSTVYDFMYTPKTSLSARSVHTIHVSLPAETTSERVITGRYLPHKVVSDNREFLQYILPDLRHLGEELQREYRAHDAEAARGDAKFQGSPWPYAPEVGLGFVVGPIRRFVGAVGGL